MLFFGESGNRLSFDVNIIGRDGSRQRSLRYIDFSAGRYFIVFRKSMKCYNKQDIQFSWLVCYDIKGFYARRAFQSGRHRAPAVSALWIIPHGQDDPDIERYADVPCRTAMYR